MPPEQHRVAVVLFNLGAPDQPSAVGPFLRNLFRDPSILRVAPPLRPLLARVIASSRVRPASENYALLGGSSPLLDLTRDQATALAAAVEAKVSPCRGGRRTTGGLGLNLSSPPPNSLPQEEGEGCFRVRCFIAMRYWHPFAEAATRAVRAWRPDRVVLMPLYPQYSSTTTGSSFADWHEAAAKAGLVAPTHTVCCYATDPAFVASIAGLVRRGYTAARAALAPTIRLRVLFSAHGLPQSIVDAGDPYQWQVEQTVATVIAACGLPELDIAICYQSRATPQRWIEPSTIAEIERAARDEVALLVVPIAFVSEHSETLVELDVEYRHLADRLGVRGYFRVPTPGADAAFVDALAAAILRALAAGPGIHNQPGGRICPGNYRDCPCRAEADTSVYATEATA